MARGVPVVASAASSLPEVYGDAAVAVEPSSVPGIAEAIQRVLGDEQLRGELVQKGLARAETFSGTETAEATLSVYDRVAKTMTEKISLITTVKDGAEHIGEFLASVRAQTRAPDEVIVVDGGSSDGTLEPAPRRRGHHARRGARGEHRAGRNVAIEAATHDVIAVSDADCVLEPDWLEKLAAPIEDGADVAMGFYRPIAETFFEKCMAAVNLPDADEVDEASFMPSARSVAYRRSAIEAAGGYPEWLDIGEDMYVDHRWRELGLDMRFVPDAVVYWRLRPGLRDTWVQYFRYARGDAIAGMYPKRHVLRFAVYGGLLLALLSSAAGRWCSRRRRGCLRPNAGRASHPPVRGSQGADGRGRCGARDHGPGRRGEDVRLRGGRAPRLRELGE